MSLRYNPRDITTIWIYRHHKGQEEFLTRAFAQGLETKSLSLDEAKASAKRLRQKAKTVNNQAIIQEVIEREAIVKKKTRKQRQKQEQSYKKTPQLPELSEVESSLPEEENIDESLASELEEMEVWDLRVSSIKGYVTF